MAKFRIAAITVLLAATTVAPAFAFKWIEGREAYDKGDYSLAVMIWTDPTVAEDASNAGDPRYYFWLASAYRGLGANEKAIATAQRGLDLKSIDPNTAGNLNWLLGTARLTLGQAGQALAAAQAAIAAQPQDPMNYKLLADVQFSQGHYDDAITAARRTIELKPNPAAYYTLAACYVQKDNLKDGLNAVRQGLELAPQDPGLLEALGHLSVRESRFADAASAFAKAFEVSHDPDALRWLALSRYMEGRYDEAISTANEMVADGEMGRVGITLTATPVPFKVGSVLPNGPAARSGITAGDWIYKVDGTKVAKQHIGGKVTALRSVDEVAAMLKGAPGSTVTIKFYRRGKFLPNQATLVREMLEAGEAAEGYAVQSLCERAKGDRERAAALAEKAAALKTDDSWARTASGFALLDAGKPDDALAVIRTNADRTEVPFRQAAQALCLAHKGEIEKAAAIYTGNRDMFDPRNAPLWRERTALVATLAPLRQDHLDRARTLEAEEKVAESLDEFAKVLQLAGDEDQATATRAELFSVASKRPTPPELPEEARRHVVRGELLIKEGNLGAALPEFTAALRLAPYVPKLYYNSALLNGQLKRYGEAMRLMRIYLQAAPNAPDRRAAEDEIYKWELLVERAKTN